MPFAEEFINAFIAGQQAKEGQFDLKRKQQRAIFEDEDRVIEKEKLAHQLKALKLEDRIKARQLAAQNLEALTGIPERDVTPEMTEGGVLPARSAIDTGGAEDSIQTLLKAITIPGVEGELLGGGPGIPEISRRPQTEESQLARIMAEARIKQETSLHNVSRGGSLVTGTGRTVATGPPVAQRPVTIRERDARGVVTERSVTPEEAMSTTRTLQPVPRQASGGGANSISGTDIEDNIAGIMSGNLPAEVPNTSVGVRIRAGLQRKGFNLAKANQELRAVRTHYSAINNSQQFNAARVSADIAEQAMQELEDVQAAWKSSGRGVFSRAALTAAKNNLMGPEAKQQAIDFESAVGEVQQAIVALRAGGANPSNVMIDQAANDINTGSNIEQAIKKLRSSLQYRIAAIRRLDAIVPSEAAGASHEYDPATDSFVPVTK